MLRVRYVCSVSKSDTKSRKLHLAHTGSIRNASGCGFRQVPLARTVDKIWMDCIQVRKKRLQTQTKTQTISNLGMAWGTSSSDPWEFRGSIIIYASMHHSLKICSAYVVRLPYAEMCVR
mmetsp:Transcript_32/g.96  ORF Transcript_32/g.96 Transcript_32/m.96 type:complete len:119 (-) Transcript_32:251-607(-)